MMTRENLQGMTVKELRGIVKERGIQGCSKMNKEELIEVIYSDVIIHQVAAEVKETIHEMENNIESNTDHNIVEDIEETSETIGDEEDSFYSKRSATISKSSKVWGGQERVRYICSHCGAKIGNPNDHFCYNCGYKFTEHTEG